MGEHRPVVACLCVLKAKRDFANVTPAPSYPPWGVRDVLSCFRCSAAPCSPHLLEFHSCFAGAGTAFRCLCGDRTASSARSGHLCPQLSLQAVRTVLWIQPTTSHPRLSPGSHRSRVPGKNCMEMTNSQLCFPGALFLSPQVWGSVT